MDESVTHWRTVLWREAVISLRGLGVWIPVCLVVYAAGYVLFEGWQNFLTVASDPLWWVLRLGCSLIVWVVCDIDHYKPRWRAIPSIILPITGAALASFALLGKHPEAWPAPVCIAAFAFGLNWLLIRRWRAHSAPERRAQSARPPAAAPAIPA